MTFPTRFTAAVIGLYQTRYEEVQHCPRFLCNKIRNLEILSFVKDLRERSQDFELFQFYHGRTMLQKSQACMLVMFVDHAIKCVV